MAVTLRFRPVLFGPLSSPTTVYHLVESTDGRAVFCEFEFGRPLDSPLDEVTVEHLPEPYRSKEAAATILPVQEATGPTAAEAHRRMTDALEALATQRLPRSRRRSRASA